MLPETIECVIAELDSAIHGENKPTQQQYRNSSNIIDFKKIVEFALSLPMDCRIKFGNDGFTFQAALIHNCVSSVTSNKIIGTNHFGRVNSTAFPAIISSPIASRVNHRLNALFVAR